MSTPTAADFPGHDPTWHRFDGPAGTLVHGRVRDAVAGYLGSGDVANDHGMFPASRHAEAVVADAAGRVRALLHATGGHVVFGANMTTLTAMFVRSVADRLRPGDEIVVTELDHEANRQPWAALAHAYDLRLRVARMAESGLLPVESVVEQLGPRTRWVAVTAASNALGTVPDLAKIVDAAQAAGARVFVDGVQAVAHHRIDLTALRCDAFVTAAYKWYGTHCGVLWCTEDTATGLRLPEQVPSAGDDPPDSLSLGTSNFEAILGAGTAAQVLAGWDRDAVLGDEQRLAARLRARLAADPAVRVLSPGEAAPGSPLVTFQVRGVAAGDVAERLARRRIAVTHGTFYAAAAMRAVAPDRPSAVRAGIACYTTAADVDALADAVDAISAGRS